MYFFYFRTVRGAIAISFIFILFSRPLLPIIEYWTNYNYISKVICINKNKPELNCNGTCYLVKKIIQNNTDDPSSEANKKLNPTLKSIDDFILCNKVQINYKKLHLIKERYFFSFITYYSSHTNQLLKPPIG